MMKRDNIQLRHHEQLTRESCGLMMKRDNIQQLTMRNYFYSSDTQPDEHDIDEVDEACLQEAEIVLGTMGS